MKMESQTVKMISTQDNYSGGASYRIELGLDGAATGSGCVVAAGGCPK